MKISEAAKRAALDIDGNTHGGNWASFDWVTGRIQKAIDEVTAAKDAEIARLREKAQAYVVATKNLGDDECA